MSNIEITKNILTARFDAINPDSIDEYISHNGYSALKKSLLKTGEEIINDIKTSNLRGRGGAAFPTGIKMEAVLKAYGSPKYIICNADEGEPGNFKDRYLMEKDPHQIIEGIIICAYATDIKHGYIFIRGEYINAINIMRKALEQARVKGYLGDNILDSGYSFDIEIYTGAGSYVCGEEFALLVTIEGKPGRSTYKPPFPTTSGLYNKPTQINNVETFCNIPHIINMGGEEFSKIGTSSSTGTKLISLSGNIISPGLYEVELGTSIRDIINKLGNGIPNNRKIKMVQIGGASGPIIPENMLDIKLDTKEMKKLDLCFGSGAIIVMDDRIDVLDILKRITEFFHHESCGKCTPCREGLTQMLILLDRFTDGIATTNDLALLEILMETMNQASICGLGQAAPIATQKVLEYFREEFTNKICSTDS
ncbi:MAG: SLBB domain-containing protein [Clostridiales bacterium]|nr:SLBB domain-containing protein [Clostridiales bacterium]